MDQDLHQLVKRVIEEELGEIVSKELELRLKPFLDITKEIRDSQDKIVKQLQDDRDDINTIVIGQATSEKQNKVIISNQNEQENKMVEAVKEEASKIPAKVEKSVKFMFENKPFLKRLRDKFKK